MQTTSHAEHLAYLSNAIAELGNVLPIQAPLQDFIHFNPLMHYEHLPFSEALRTVFKQSGSMGYLRPCEYRRFYKQGRINRHDLAEILEKDGIPLDEQDIYITALIHNVKAISFQQMRWQVEENHALERFQPDLPFEKREAFLEHAQQDEASAIMALWQMCLARMELNYDLPHPEALINLRLTDINHVWERIKQQGQLGEVENAEALIHQQSRDLLHQLMDQVGEHITLRGLLYRLNRIDVLDRIQPHLTRYLGNWLDQGVAATHADRADTTFYHYWRTLAQHDITANLEGMVTWRDYISSLDDDPLETIHNELMRMGVEKSHWGAYLRSLALELAGWSGMFNWRSKRANYLQLPVPCELHDYLAVRLVLEHLYCRNVTRSHWQLDADLTDIRGYFHRHSDEFFVRYHAYNTTLPEYLQHLAEECLESQEDILPEAWHQLAHQILTWNLAPETVIPVGTDIYHKVWRLFHLAQHLGLSADDMQHLPCARLDRMLCILSELDDPNTSGYLWLRAYEYHFQQEIFSALLTKNDAVNTAHNTPKAQLIFCMDDREESIRRHLEEIAPELETLGAAGVFGMPNHWQALDAPRPIKLAQPVVTAVHEFREVPTEGDQDKFSAHQQRWKWFTRLKKLKNHTMRHNVVGTLFSLPFLAPFAVAELIGRSFFPSRYHQTLQRWQQQLTIPLRTRVAYTATEVLECPTLEHNQIGLSFEEKVTKVAQFLKLTSFTDKFSPLVVFMAHRSRHINNPHILGYGCGACSGRFGAPNARVFVNSANEPDVRAALATEHGIHIPETCWFVAGDHDTTNDDVMWLDTDLVPSSHHALLAEVQAAVLKASELSAHERCRKFASAPKRLTPKRAKRHVENRATSPDQVRAELGHQGCAVAFIATRQLSKSIFWDRRSFLISYDAALDPNGLYLEAQLQGNGVVGVGIAMDYYFSRMQSGYFGSGSKATHNLMGLFGVMEGASSDLRTGLAQQMVELHEPMRLLVIVEAPVETLVTIYQRHAYLRQLLDNEWVLLAVKPPNLPEIQVFQAGKGFVKWQGMLHKLPNAACSMDWYEGHHGHLPPALLTGGELA